MSKISGWLKDHEYENKLIRVKDVKSGSNMLLKVVEVRELSSSVVSEVVEKMRILNEMKLDGLMRYKVIEVSGDSFYRISREYRVNLDIINPLKYFEEIGVFEVLNGILLVLKVLNNNGLIHSDLKPSNVFLNDENEVIIGDYLNSLLYKRREGRKPERSRDDLCFVCIDELLGLELDIFSDIWNFGLIFYYVLSNKYPFIGSNMFETMKNIENVKYDLIYREYDSDRLNSFLSKILIKEKNKRMKLNEIEIELKNLNEAELPVIPFEEEEMKIDEELKTKINSIIEECKNSNENQLNFEKFKMGDAGMKYLCSRLETMNHVTGINIQDNDLSSNGLNIFSKCLKFIHDLQELYLYVNPIGNGGLKVFSENLHFIPKLKRLGLSDCGLVDDDIKDLSSHFKDINNLEYLGIFDNKISDDGVRYLCENINEIPKLKQLFLHNNMISDTGGEILLNNLPKCKELEILFMKENRISNCEDFERRMEEKHPNKSLFIN